MLYEKIKEVCRERGISVTSVEKKAGLSNGAISKWNVSMPTASNLQAVAVTLDLPMEYFLDSDTSEKEGAGSDN